MPKEKEKKEFRVAAKYVHVTLHNLTNDSLEYWLEKGYTFRPNTVACLVGLEENHEEGKGLHAHIMIQFSTKQDISRKQFIEWFGTESLHVTSPTNKNDLLHMLGYVVKAGTHRQRGEFTYRGKPIDGNPEVLRFHHQVKNAMDGLEYFEKIILERLEDSELVIDTYAKRRDDIGRWLRKQNTERNTLRKFELLWRFDHRNSKKKGFDFAPFMQSPSKLSEAYREYLRDFPVIFKENLPIKSTLQLERDYDKHEAHDLQVLDTVRVVLGEALKYGHERPHKSLNLFLWSSMPSFGKSRLLKFLGDRLMAYRLPDDQYYTEYQNFRYQVLVSDETEAFLKTKDYSHLKHLLEGAQVEFNLKGKTKLHKEDNPLIVLADNVSLDTIMRKHFPKRYQPEVIRTRVLDLELRSRATLHFLLDRCIVTDQPSEPKRPFFEQQELDL